MDDTMDVTVTIRVKVDRQAWAAEYGDGDTTAQVRASVKSYIGNQASGSYPVEAGIITDVAWK